MISELFHELKNLVIGIASIQKEQEYLLDLYTGDAHNVGDDSVMPTDEDLRGYPHLVDEADHREVEALCNHKVFIPRLKRYRLAGANVVDCVWVRKWSIKYKKVKSRVCARGCFDKQKQLLESIQARRRGDHSDL